MIGGKCLLIVTLNYNVKIKIVTRKMYDFLFFAKQADIVIIDKKQIL